MSPPPLEPHNHSQTHLKLSGRLLLQAPFTAGLRTAKSLKTLWIQTLLSLESLTFRSSSRKWPKSLSIYDFRLKQVALLVLVRLAQLWIAQRALVNFGLALVFLLGGWTQAVRLVGLALAQRTCTTHPSSRFFLTLSQRSVALSGWLAKPEDWLSERMKINTSQTCLINLKLRGNDY